MDSEGIFCCLEYFELNFSDVLFLLLEIYICIYMTITFIKQKILLPPFLKLHYSLGKPENDFLRSSS